MKGGENRTGDLTPIGDLPLVKSLAKKVAPSTKAQLKLIEAAAAIREQPDAAERAFMVRQLVLCTLPHDDPGDTPRWMRRTSSGTLIIQPGWDADKDKSIGYPSGIIPRLLLFWMITDVQRTKNREDMTDDQKRTLQLGNHLSAFMEAVGLNPRGGGKRSDAKRLHDQMTRLLASRITFQDKLQDGDTQGASRDDSVVAEKSLLWWNPKRPEQGTLMGSWVLLSKPLYDAFVASPVPVDMRALRALKSSALALDLYAWVCYSVFLNMQQQRPLKFTTWKSLMQQLGTGYADVKDFKRYAKVALRKIRTVYPGLTVAGAKGGFTIHASRLAVPQKPKLIDATIAST